MNTTQADEVAANMDLTGLRTYADCARYVRSKMPDETETVRDNVVDALYNRVQANRFKTWSERTQT